MCLRIDFFPTKLSYDKYNIDSMVQLNIPKQIWKKGRFRGLIIFCLHVMPICRY